MAIGKYKPLTLAPINFSLTEGTSIPAPPDSPPDTPHPPTPGKGPLSSHPTPKTAFFPENETASPPAKDGADSAAGSTLANQNTHDSGSGAFSPSSPNGSKRPSSVRKFWGLRPLSSHDSISSERPGSPATIGSQPSLTRKKSGSWFKNRRQSTFFAGSLPEGKEMSFQSNGTTNGTTPKPAAKTPEKKGPPPPALPELKSFGVSEDTLSLGAEDLFKNIK